MDGRLVRVYVSHEIWFKSYVCIIAFNRIFGCFTFFHTKCNTKEYIFNNVKYAVDIPIVLVFLVGKGRRIQKEEKGRGKINKNGDDDPELFGVIYKKYRRVLDLAIKE